MNVRNLMWGSGYSVELGRGRPGFKSPLCHEAYWAAMGKSISLSLTYLMSIECHLKLLEGRVGYEYARNT